MHVRLGHAAHWRGPGSQTSASARNIGSIGLDCQAICAKLTHGPPAWHSGIPPDSCPERICIGGTWRAWRTSTTMQVTHPIDQRPALHPLEPDTRGPILRRARSPRRARDANKRHMHHRGCSRPLCRLRANSRYFRHRGRVRGLPPRGGPKQSTRRHCQAVRTHWQRNP